MLTIQRLLESTVSSMATHKYRTLNFWQIESSSDFLTIWEHIRCEGVFRMEWTVLHMYAECFNCCVSYFGERDICGHKSFRQVQMKHRLAVHDLQSIWNHLLQLCSTTLSLLTCDTSGVLQSLFASLSGTAVRVIRFYLSYCHTLGASLKSLSNTLRAISDMVLP